MISRLTRIAGASALIAAAASTAHAAEFSGNVTLATDYILRGVSQTEERPAIQGGFEDGGARAVRALFVWRRP
jgi:uncharacterized protein (TIGR02001 family)